MQYFTLETRLLMNHYIADTVVMIRPNFFGFNEETAESNAFQQEIDAPINNIRISAIGEFEVYVELLRSHGINVLVYDDQKEPYTPDAVFPNNWFSTCPHTDRLFLYPMKNTIRAAERRQDIVDDLAEITGYKVDKSLLSYEAEDRALEGTGSLVLDHQNKIAYAAISPRTDMNVLTKWCEMSGFDMESFDTSGPSGELIYHTNVMMTMADDYVVICLSCLKNAADRERLESRFQATGKEVIDITVEQMNKFAGNMLQVQNVSGQKFLIMSRSAKLSLLKYQEEIIEEKHDNQILAANIPTIETIGGGSARCMIAEVFGNKNLLVN